MKYRRLYPDELQELEADFIRFLAANTVTAADWVKLKTTTPEKAEKLIDLFSDLVFEKTLTKVKYLQRKLPQDLQIFNCLPDKIMLRGLRVTEGTDFDFTRNDSPEQMMQQIRQSGAELRVYRAEKAYAKERELELFEMMEQGCLISDGEIFELLGT